MKDDLFKKMPKHVRKLWDDAKAHKRDKDRREFKQRNLGESGRTRHGA